MNTVMLPIVAVIIMLSAIFRLVARSMKWKRFRHSSLTIIFLHQEDWDHPVGKVLDVIDPIIMYSVGYWILITKVF